MLKKISFFTLVIFSHIIQAKFLLVMGPSGVGKSTIIRRLKQMDSRFTYVTPLTTRELREGEKDKIHASLEEINKLDMDGSLLAINRVYGVYYATSKYIIDTALDRQRFPVLDWPIERIDVMEKNYADQIYRVYVEPDNIQELERRLSFDNRDKDGERYVAGVRELNRLMSGEYDQFIDLRLVNKSGCAEDTATCIYNNFLLFLES